MSVGVDRPFSGTSETVHNSLACSLMVKQALDRRPMRVRFPTGQPIARMAKLVKASGRRVSVKRELTQAP